MAISPSSVVHGGQHDTKYVAFELLIRAAFVADEILGFVLEPAHRNHNSQLAASNFSQLSNIIPKSGDVMYV